MAGSEKLVASIRDGVPVLEPFETAMRRAREIARGYAEPGKSVVDELLAERRRDAANDEEPSPDSEVGH